MPQHLDAHLAAYSGAVVRPRHSWVLTAALVSAAIDRRS